MQNKKMPGRNDPCWCGSGKKFKKCHWPTTDPSPQTPAGISPFGDTLLTETLQKMMNVDFDKFNKDDLKGSKNYLFQILQNNLIPDVADPGREDYMEFAYALEAWTLKKENDKAVTRLYKELYKSVLKSEKKFNYQLYKGHILVKLATVSLITERDLDKIVSLLNQAHQQDIFFGYKNPTHRPAYKILSFLQPLLTFRDRLWPSDEEARKKVGTGLRIVLHMNKSSIGFTFTPDCIKNDVQGCIKNNEALLNIINENLNELSEIMMLCDKNRRFYKSIMFLVGNIVEGILYNLAISANVLLSEQNQIKLEKASISKLAEELRKNSVIDIPTEYHCRFIQHYRDFIHPVRNLKHEYMLSHDVNFNKMFLFFLILLLADLQKSSEKLALSQVAIQPV
jgi:hypothetical protein